MPLNLFNLDSQQSRKMFHKRIIPIGMDVFYMGNAGSQKKTAANDAGIMGDVGCCVFAGNPAFRAIHEGILFGM
jgi:hypothetical protein